MCFILPLKFKVSSNWSAERKFGINYTTKNCDLDLKSNNVKVFAFSYLTSILGLKQ